MVSPCPLVPGECNSWLLLFRRPSYKSEQFLVPQAFVSFLSLTYLCPSCKHTQSHRSPVFHLWPVAAFKTPGFKKPSKVQAHSRPPGEGLWACSAQFLPGKRLEFIIMLPEKLEAGYRPFALSSVPYSFLSQKSCLCGLNLLRQTAESGSQVI